MAHDAKSAQTTFRGVHSRERLQLVGGSSRI